MNDILKWILYSGGFAVIVSWVCERIPQMNDLPSNTKAVIQFVASTVIALASYAALTYIPADVWVTIDPWVNVILGVAAVYGINQIGHTVDPVRIRNAAEAVAETPAPVEVVKR